ncbi:hypothetical protein SR870_22285 [Rhodopseudomonas palustris]|uniref:hypothetical protein n=1 Tax=Rhodopseudomonas palustris TaxID=1076 RepID=UPI002ACD2AC1|nr:hypothetical protein [Rhodopseudomonas palustris]WQG99365.1 hypothetical protein SR870_22285 [Rhodopseudomonas palustris]
MLCRLIAIGLIVLLGGTAVQAVSDAAHAAPWRADEGNTRGWMLMSPQERIAHQARVRGFTDYDSCEAYRAEHHALMVQRARERGLDLPGGHWDFCSRLKRN